MYAFFWASFIDERQNTALHSWKIQEWKLHDVLPKMEFSSCCLFPKQVYVGGALTPFLKRVHDRDA